ncbi:MAG TPA: carbamate kinase [Actinomycetota bacterium]|nr:carbamate kinase [Actinomycetota bacterium]
METEHRPASVSVPRAAHTVVVALGGNAMTGPSGEADQASQLRAVAVAAGAVAKLIASGYEVVVTHGNGPQVGNILVKNELARGVVPPVSLDWCVAHTQATIGFMLMNGLEKALEGGEAGRRVATLITRVLVDPRDPAWNDPSKPVGRYLSEEDAAALAATGQVWKPQGRPAGSKGWRRVVPSPEPREIVDAAPIEMLMSRGVVVVAAGGGGVPVVRGADGSLQGVEAVLDKDLTAALLARTVGAGMLLIATDVEHAMVDFGTPRARPIETTTPSELRQLAAQGHFSSGSMGPKVEAVARFVEGGGHRAVITSLDRLEEGVEGRSGTVVEPAR